MSSLDQLPPDKLLEHPRDSRNALDRDFRRIMLRLRDWPDTVFHERIINGARNELIIINNI